MTTHFIANWKSHKNTAEVQRWLTEFGQSWPTVAVTAPDDWSIAIAPPFSLLGPVSNRIQILAEQSTAPTLTVCAQDISPYSAGSYTGAVSARNLEGLVVTQVIVGHSERRRYFDESHQDVAQKVTQALDAGLQPVVCVDEEYIQAQAAALDPSHLDQVIVAYEPLEAIGSGENQSVEEVTPVVEKIHDVFGQVPVLYGGSVDASNVAPYLTVTNGVLVGGASLKASDFVSLLQAARSDSAPSA